MAKRGTCFSILTFFFFSLSLFSFPRCREGEGVSPLLRREGARGRRRGPTAMSDGTNDPTSTPTLHRRDHQENQDVRQGGRI